MKPRLPALLRHPAGKVLISFVAIVLLSGVGIFAFQYNKYANLTEEKLARGPFTNTSKLFAAPQVLSLGDEAAPDEVAAYLQRSGYGRSKSNRMGWFQVRADRIEIFPGGESYFQEEPGLIRFENGRIAQIISLRDNTERRQYLLEPELITNLFDRNREKRRIVRFQDIPPIMIKAVISAEDKRFFSHAGFDPFRILKSAWVDLKEQRHAHGASTLSMQLARSLWLTNERTWRRKWPEILITLHLERKLTKEEIFEHYANQIYVGRVGSFNIHGFGEAAQVFFGKDLSLVTAPEAALLAGIVQSPGRFNPLRNPDRARSRRNIILQLMLDNGHISEAEYLNAVNCPLGVVTNRSESDDAPYFVDLINEFLQTRFQDHDFQANTYRVYTPLDLNLQRAAAESIRIGIKETDEILRRRGRTPEKGWPLPQAAIVVLDARTGEVKALSGGRDYGQTQLNRAVAMRPAGSSFKPFVYAALLSRSAGGEIPVVTPISTVTDEATVFSYEDKFYEPNNYKSQFYGPVNLRFALTKSLNVPAVKFAEMAGYQAVADLARRAGMNEGVKPTPSIALGAYEVTPLEMAGAYTVFSNKGLHIEPRIVGMIRDQSGRILHTAKASESTVLDPRVAYIITNLLEDVLNRGTGAGVRARGFTLPAAGKTGTSHDAWFAGYTTELICVVWVGFDDNRDLGIEGAKAALPIWTEFMKRAHQFRPYRNAAPFAAPDGVVAVEIDPETGLLATAGCQASARMEVFIAGTEPLRSCAGGGTRVASWELPEQPAPAPPASNAPRGADLRAAAAVPSQQPPAAPSKPAPAPAKKGFFSRILGVFR